MRGLARAGLGVLPRGVEGVADTPPLQDEVFSKRQAWHGCHGSSRWVWVVEHTAFHFIKNVSRDNLDLS